MSIPSNQCRLFFRTMTGGSLVVDVDRDATTDELISCIAKKMNAPKDKIMFSLDHSLDIKGRVATQENAKDVDTKVQEQFNSNIVYFMERRSAGIVVVKH